MSRYREEKKPNTPYTNTPYSRPTVSGPTVRPKFRLFEADFEKSIKEYVDPQEHRSFYENYTKSTELAIQQVNKAKELDRQNSYWLEYYRFCYDIYVKSNLTIQQFNELDRQNSYWEGYHILIFLLNERNLIDPNCIVTIEHIPAIIKGYLFSGDTATIQHFCSTWPEICKIFYENFRLGDINYHYHDTNEIFLHIDNFEMNYADVFKRLFGDKEVFKKKIFEKSCQLNQSKQYFYHLIMLTIFLQFRIHKHPENELFNVVYNLFSSFPKIQAFIMEKKGFFVDQIGKYYAYEKAATCTTASLSL